MSYYQLKLDIITYLSTFYIWSSLKGTFRYLKVCIHTAFIFFFVYLHDQVSLIEISVDLHCIVTITKQILTAHKYHFTLLYHLNSAFVMGSAPSPVYFKQIPLNAYDLFLFHFLAKRNQTLLTFGFIMVFL